MAWLELKIETTSEAIDWVRTLLPTVGYSGIMRVTPYQPDGESPPPWDWSVRFYLPDQPSSRIQCQEIEQRLFALHRTGLTTTLQIQPVEHVPDDDTVSKPVHRIADRFVIVPAANSIPLSLTNDIPIHLSSHLAFGSGLHPATILCLRLISRHVAAGMTALDLGSGSGILSVAMAKLGATVQALDNDPIAVEATRAAAIQNQVADRLTAMVGSLGEGSELGHWMGGTLPEPVDTLQAANCFDVIVANILARIHMAIAPAYQHALRQGSGVVMTAGFTADVEVDVLEHLSNAGLEIIDCERYDEWVAFAHRRVD